MKANVLPQAALLETAATPKAERVIPWIVLGTLWLGLLSYLGERWAVDSQYSFGFFVPLLALYLFGLRWSDRGPVRPSSHPGLLLFIAGFIAALLMPLSLLGETDPQWSVISWGGCAIVVGISLVFLFYRAGSRWAWHFLFPTAFIFTAVPWPPAFESHLVQAMMGVDASVAVKALQWLGIPALRQGSIIRTDSGLVGVNEACSGIRSLQTTWMVSLFLGELYRMRLWRRLLLIPSALVVAFLCNLARTFCLAGIAAEQSPGAMEKWHDTLGLLVLVVSMAALWALAWAVRGRPALQPSRVDAPARLSYRPWPVKFLVCLGAWLALIPIAVGFWYGTGPARAHASGWSVEWPRQEPAVRVTPLAPSTHEILRNTGGSHATWKDESGIWWSAYFIWWAPSRTAYILAMPHRPENCLCAAGMTLVKDNGLQVYDVDGLRIPFLSYVFEAQGRTVRVWYSRWDDESAASLRIEGSEVTRADRVNSFLARRRRNFAEQTLEIAMVANDPSVQPEAAFKRVLSETIRRSQSP